jgi:hypothetical protein
MQAGIKDDRANYLEMLKFLKIVAKGNSGEAANAMTFLKNAILPGAEYSYMAATYLNNFEFA